jgi:fatty acid desaturase
MTWRCVVSGDVKTEDLESSDPRTAAVARLRAKRHLRDKAFMLGGLTIFFVAIWALSGAGSFWPVWIILAFALALAGDVWTLYGRRPITEADIDQEMAKRR